MASVFFITSGNAALVFPKDWLVYCLYNDSYEVTKELLWTRKKNLEDSQDELKTN